MKLETAFKNTYGTGGLLGAAMILQKVLKLVSIPKTEMAERVSIIPYENGREKGFGIKVSVTDTHEFVVRFSENRNSDDWVVYEEKAHYRRIQEIPSQKSYEERKTFRAEHLERVARHIAKRLQKELAA